MTTCKLTGTLTFMNGDPLSGALIYISTPTNPLFVTSSGYTYGVSFQPETFFTTSTGYFELNLIRNATFKVVIKDIGLRSTFIVPDMETVELFTLLSQVPEPDVPVNPTW